MTNRTIVEVDTKTFVRFWLVIAGIVGFLWIFAKAQTAIIITLLSIFLSISIRPLAKKIDRVIKKRRGPTTPSSTVFALLFVVVFVILVVGLVGPMMISETQKFLVVAPEMIGKTLGEVGGLDTIGNKFGINNLTEQISTSVKSYFTGTIPDLSSTVLTSVSAIAGVVSNTILLIVLTLLFMLQGPDLINEFWKKMYKKGDKTGQVVKRVTTRIAEVIERYVTGQVMVALIDAVFVFILTA
ncbi:MAG: AI-2E family transporter, partial [Candidatus Saccharibacteria bacterium]|nr:AI-2E family transporter [Candidatus Saccharibacteria bacterium]